jgi:hypothetical protein
MQVYSITASARASRVGSTARLTPVVIVEKLNKEINTGLTDPKLKARLADLGGTVLAGSPAEFGKLIADETEKWAKVIRAANIKPEQPGPLIEIPQNSDARTTRHVRYGSEADVTFPYFECLLYPRKRTFLRVYEYTP